MDNKKEQQLLRTELRILAASVSFFCCCSGSTASYVPSSSRIVVSRRSIIYIHGRSEGVLAYVLRVAWRNQERNKHSDSDDHGTLAKPKNVLRTLSMPSIGYVR
jgi:hypothetical protein